MRSRNIKPGFFTDEDLVECSFGARLLFAGLPCLADRMGRLEDRPKKIKMLLFPADNLNCSELLDELVSAGKIKRYEVDGKRCVWIPGFLNHQEPHRREKTSTLPRHPEDDNPEEGVQAKDEPGSVLGQNKSEPRKGRAALIPDSSFLIPDSPPTPHSEESSEGLHGGVEENPNGIETQAYAVSLEIQQIGEGYPEHRYDPGAAEIAMKALAKVKQWPGMLRIQEDIAKRLESEEWTRDDRKAVPKLSKYIRERMWINPLPKARADPVGPATPRGITDEEYEAMMARQAAQPKPAQERYVPPPWKPGMAQA